MDSDRTQPAYHKLAFETLMMHNQYFMAERNVCVITKKTAINDQYGIGRLQLIRHAADLMTVTKTALIS